MKNCKYGISLYKGQMRLSLHKGQLPLQGAFLKSDSENIVLCEGVGLKDAMGMRLCIRIKIGIQLREMRKCLS